jgi:hypothetical protein
VRLRLFADQLIDRNNRRAVKSFFFDFASDDHHINVVEATSGIRAINGNTVTVAANARYADKNFDDSYSGQVHVLVIAQVA